jgi:indolepyruvate ferredoxin oxidoreductase beta subunit
MKYDIVISGVGGQGILVLSAFLAKCAHEVGLSVKQCEVHGMAQRGGSVVAHLRLSDKEIHSPLIPEHTADMMIGMDPLEIYRYMNYTNKDTKLIVASEPVINIPNYPSIETILEPLKKANAVMLEKATNITLVGAASRFMPIDVKVFEKVLVEFFAPKGQEVLLKNQQDFEQGRKA